MKNQPAAKRPVRWTILISIVGALLLLFTCVISAGSLFLDVAGAKTTGTLNNIAECSGSRTCFTAEISFTTKDGETISYLPLLQNSAIYEAHRIVNLTNEPGAGSRSVYVQYLESNPRLAKVSLNYHLEYVNVLIWFFWSAVVSLIGMAVNRSKPFVLDFRKRK